MGFCRLSPEAEIRSEDLKFRLVQFGKVSLQGVKATDNRVVKLLVYLCYIRHSVADDFGGVMYMTDRGDPSGPERWIIRS